MRILFLLVLLAALTLNAHAQVRIASMDIYPGGIKAVFEIEAAADMSFTLPAAFTLESIKPVPVTGLTVEYFQKAYITNSEAVPDTLQSLYKTITSKEADLAKLKADIEANKQHLEMLMNISKRDINVQQGPAVYVKSLLDLYTSSSEAMWLLSLKKDEMEKELARLNEDYKKRLPANYNHLIEVSMGVKGSGKVRVEGYSTSAGWTPSYKMNLNSTTKEVKSIFVAQAYQKTGLNYNGPISFHTQNPPSGLLYTPKPAPLIADFVPEYTPAPAASRVMNQMSASEMALDYYKGEEAVPAPPMVNETLTNFSVKGKGYIRGDGTAVSVDLGEQTFKSKLKVVLFRDYGREGHLVATLEKINEPMLPGRAELTVDGQNSGQTQIANYGRGEDVMIPFGYMPLVKVNKTTDVAKTGSGFRTGTIQDGYSLEAVNGSSLSLDIELIDRIPVSANDKITVDNITVEPAATKNENNILTWEMTLKPGETKKFNVNYRVRHPSDKDIYFR